jgi:SAM-dependent methyltransferase
MVGAHIADLVEFYASPLGQQAVSVVGKAVSKLWHIPEGEEGAVLALGYAPPYMQKLPLNPHHALIYAMLEQQGGQALKDGEGNNITSLTDSQRLPFSEASFDRVVCAHAVEQSTMEAIFHEIERVLIPLGEAILIIPNRRGLWARVETTPWAFGNPYSLKRIRSALSHTSLMITEVSAVLYIPPSHYKGVVLLRPLWEGLGCFLPQQWAGVYVIRVVKQIYATVQPHPTRKVYRQPLLKPVSVFCDESSLKTVIPENSIKENHS